MSYKFVDEREIDWFNEAFGALQDPVAEVENFAGPTETPYLGFFQTPPEAKKPFQLKGILSLHGESIVDKYKLKEISYAETVKPYPTETFEYQETWKPTHPSKPQTSYLKLLDPDLEILERKNFKGQTLDSFAKTESLNFIIDPHKEPETTPLYKGPEEEKLKSEFEDLVSNINLEDTLEMQPDRKVPKNIDEYSLVPIRSVYGQHSSLGSGSSLKVPEGVKCNYGSPGGRPYLDTGLAIGLVYRGELRAVAGGCLGSEGQILVKQLQGVDYRTKDPKQKFKTGLHSGFYWRDTLVRAWMQIAEQLDVGTVEVQGATNNSWLSADRLPTFVQGYDDVAKRMGFTFSHASNNWVLSLNER